MELAQAHPNDKQDRPENKVAYTNQMQLGYSELLVEIYTQQKKVVLGTQMNFWEASVLITVTFVWFCVFLSRNVSVVRPKDLDLSS